MPESGPLEPLKAHSKKGPARKKHRVEDGGQGVEKSKVQLTDSDHRERTLINLRTLDHQALKEEDDSVRRPIYLSIGTNVSKDNHAREKKMRRSPPQFTA